MQKNVTYYVESYKTAFLASLFLIGAISIYRWFVVPHQDYLAAAQKYESTVRTLDGKKQIIRNDLKTKRIKYEKLQDQYNHLQSKLFDTLSEREFFSNVEDICRKAGCKMLSLSFSQSSAADFKSEKKSNENKNTVTSAAQLVVEGRYENIISLMNRLQDGTKLVKINPVNISSNNKNPGYLKCSMTITIFVTNEMKAL